MFGRKKKHNIVKWAEAIYEKPLLHPERESEEQLAALTEMLILQDIRIINDSVSIIHNTRNADTKQGRIDLAQKR